MNKTSMLVAAGAAFAMTIAWGGSSTSAQTAPKKVAATTCKSIKSEAACTARTSCLWHNDYVAKSGRMTAANCGKKKVKVAGKVLKKAA